MMDPMVSGRYYDIFQPAQFFDVAGMVPELGK